MADRNKELAINTVILGIGQLVPKLLALIVLPILTTYLSTEEYGVYDLITSFANLLIPILTLQIQQAVFRYLLATLDKSDREKYVSSSLLFAIISSIIILPICFFILKYLEVSNLYSVFICILFFAEAFYHLLGQIVRGLGFNLKYSVSVIVYSTVNMFLTVAIVACIKLGLTGVIVSLTLAYIGADIYMIFSSGMHRYISVKYFSRETLKNLLSFSVPIVPSSIALWIVNLSDRMVILHFLGASANGIYAVANRIPTLYNTAYHVFNLAWTETASRVSDDGSPEAYYSKTFRVLYNFLIGVMLLLIAFTPAIFKLLVRGDYGSAIYQVPILYFGVFFNSFVNYYSGIYIAIKRTKQVGISSAVGAILNLGINLLMVNKYGLFAASVSTAISFMIIALYRAYDLNKVIKIKYNFKEIILGMVIFCCASTLLFVGNWWCIIATFILAIAYNLKMNLSFYKKIFNMGMAMIKKKKKQ